MTFEEVVKELKVKHPNAEMSPAAMRGESARRAARLQFTRGKGGLYSGNDADGTEVLVYFNDTANLICCTEIESDDTQDDD
jgi:hypothetical protein